MTYKSQRLGDIPVMAGTPLFADSPGAYQAQAQGAPPLPEQQPSPEQMALIRALVGGSMHPLIPQQPGAFNPQGSVLNQASDQYLAGPVPMGGIQVPSYQEPQPGMVPGVAGLPPGPQYTGQLPITQQPPAVAAQKRY